MRVAWSRWANTSNSTPIMSMTTTPTNIRTNKCLRSGWLSIFSFPWGRDKSRALFIVHAPHVDTGPGPFWEPSANSKVQAQLCHDDMVLDGKLDQLGR